MIIGLQGYGGTGKSEVARYLESEFRFKRHHIKTPLSDMFAVLLRAKFPGISDSDLQEVIDGSRKRDPIPELGGRTSTEIQQFLGTEFGRDFIGPNLWIDIWAAWAKKQKRAVLESVRFPNEAAACDEIWEIRRPGVGPVNGHPSESLPGAPSLILDNAGTLPELFFQVHCAMKARGLQ